MLVQTPVTAIYNKQFISTHHRNAFNTITMCTVFARRNYGCNQANWTKRQIIKLKSHQPPSKLLTFCSRCHSQSSRWTCSHPSCAHWSASAASDSAAAPPRPPASCCPRAASHSRSGSCCSTACPPVWRWSARRRNSRNYPGFWCCAAC